MDRALINFLTTTKKHVNKHRLSFKFAPFLGWMDLRRRKSWNNPTAEYHCSNKEQARNFQQIADSQKAIAKCQQEIHHSDLNTLVISGFGYWHINHMKSMELAALCQLAFQQHFYQSSTKKYDSMEHHKSKRNIDSYFVRMGGPTTFLSIFQREYDLMEHHKSK